MRRAASVFATMALAVTALAACGGDGSEAYCRTLKEAVNDKSLAKVQIDGGADDAKRYLDVVQSTTDAAPDEIKPLWETQLAVAKEFDSAGGDAKKVDREKMASLVAKAKPAWVKIQKDAKTRCKTAS